MVNEVKYIEDTDYKITSFNLNYIDSEGKYYYKAEISLNMHRTVEKKYIKCSQEIEQAKCFGNDCGGIHGAFEDKELFMEHFCKLVIILTNQLNKNLKKGAIKELKGGVVEERKITLGELALMIREGKFKHKNKCKLINEIWYQTVNFIIHVVMSACNNVVEVVSDTDDYIMKYLESKSDKNR